MQYVRVEKEDIDAVWPDIAAWVDTARGVDHSYSVEDIRILCLTRMDLWLAKDGNVIKGFLIGSTSVRPQGKIYFGSWLGGVDLALWVNGFKFIEQWAQESGHMGLGFIGRKAWKKLVGYDYEAAYYYKNLR